MLTSFGADLLSGRYACPSYCRRRKDAFDGGIDICVGHLLSGQCQVTPYACPGTVRAAGATPAWHHRNAAGDRPVRRNKHLVGKLKSAPSASNAKRNAPAGFAIPGSQSTRVHAIRRLEYQRFTAGQINEHRPKCIPRGPLAEYFKSYPSPEVIIRLAAPAPYRCAKKILREQIEPKIFNGR